MERRMRCRQRRRRQSLKKLHLYLSCMIILGYCLCRDGSISSEIVASTKGFYTAGLKFTGVAFGTLI